MKNVIEFLNSSLVDGNTAKASASSPKVYARDTSGKLLRNENDKLIPVLNTDGTEKRRASVRPRIENELVKTIQSFFRQAQNEFNPRKNQENLIESDFQSSLTSSKALETYAPETLEKTVKRLKSKYESVNVSDKDIVSALLETIKQYNKIVSLVVKDAIKTRSTKDENFATLYNDATMRAFKALQTSKKPRKDKANTAKA